MIAGTGEPHQKHQLNGNDEMNDWVEDKVQVDAAQKTGLLHKLIHGFFFLK